jgi:hypothetical protein
MTINVVLPLSEGCRDSTNCGEQNISAMQTLLPVLIVNAASGLNPSLCPLCALCIPPPLPLLLELLNG